MSDGLYKLFVWYVDAEGYAYCTDLYDNKFHLFKNNYLPFNVEKGDLLYIDFDKYGNITYIESRKP